MNDDSESPPPNGASQESGELLPLVYDRLRKLAARKLAEEPSGMTLDPTGLVHEAYLRLVEPGRENAPAAWNHEGHFFAAAAEAMRRILIERARGKAAARRGGDWKRVDLERFDPVRSVAPDQLAAFDESLERLFAIDPVAGELVKIRCFAGLSLERAAAVMAISRATAYRHWSFARAWLHDELTREG
ncbi:MAG TPA: ECF-type sigma factor [Planctomycetia bacterium]|nr:ECF-type sigma factor [Planctomycetia bacterium]